MDLASGEVKIFKAIFMVKVTGSKSKVASGAGHDITQLYHGRNISAKFELLPVYGHYGYRDLTRKKFYISIFRRIFIFKVTRSRLYLGLTMTVHN